MSMASRRAPDATPDPEEVPALRERVTELEETLLAIRNGEVDALVNEGRIYSLESAESASNRFRGQVLAQMNDAVVAVDNDHHVTYLNTAAEKLYACKASDVLGHRLNVLYTSEWIDPADAVASAKALDEHDQWRGENVHRLADGKRMHVESTVTVLRDPNHVAAGSLAVIRDISERVHAEKALREADRQKDHFLATLAHELRNPLAPLRSGLELLDTPGAEQESAMIRAMMKRQLDHMVHLVDDLLDVSRITRGLIELRLEPLSVFEVVEQALEGVQGAMDAAGHQLTLQLPSQPVQFMGDRTRVIQVISNLLSNAIKYTEHGGRLHFTVSSTNGHLVFTLRDNGVGIPADKLGRVFDLFSQVEAARSRSQGGLGIGLHIVKRVVEMHGGTVRAESEGPGKGSTFVVVLPLAAAAPSKRR